MKIIVAFLLLSFSIAVVADCNDDPNNLISSSNCAFDSDVSGWDVFDFFIDSIVHDASQDFMAQGAGNGSALVDAQSNGLSFFTMQASHTCLSLSTTDDLDKSGGVWLRVNSGSGVTCSMTLRLYSNMICDAIDQVGTCTTGPVSDIPIDGNWSQLTCDSADSGALTAAPVTFFPAILCESANDFTVNVDNLYIGQAGLLPVELIHFSVE